MHHIPRTRIRAKKKKERTSTKDAYDNAAPFIEHFDQFSPPYLFLRRKIHLTRRLVVRRFFFECTRSGLLRDYTTTSTRRFIAIIYNRYTFIILVRMAHIHIQ
jgi:hypothetical protein